MIKYCKSCGRDVTVDEEENYCPKCGYLLRIKEKNTSSKDVIKKYNLFHGIIGFINLLLISSIIAMLFIKPIFSLILFIVLLFVLIITPKLVKNIDREYFDFLQTTAGKAYTEKKQQAYDQYQARIQEQQMESPKYQAKQRIAENKQNAIACCPKCGSTSLSANKKGYGVVKGALGATLAPFGLVGSAVGLGAGNIGRNNVLITCLNCGHKFKPGK